MDLVKIGFQINANGLKDANTEVDKLLDKVDNIGTKGKKASSDFENSQKKVKDSTQQASKEVDKTTKALEKQKIIGDYLGKGLDKTTASIMANFQMLGAKTTDLDKMFTQLGKNKGAVELNNKVKKLQKEYNAISKASVKYLGGGILDQVGYQEQDLKNLNDQYRKAEQQVKEHGQKIYKQYEDISKSSTKRLGRGILDRIGFQESDLIELNNQYKAAENATKAQLAETEKIRKQYDDISKSATKNLGGGVLDRVSTKNTELEEMRKMYKEDERIADARDKSQQATLEKEKLINAERQKAIALEQAKAKYVSQGYGKTDSTRLARLEVSGADVTTLNNYKAAIEATTRATQALNPPIEKATVNHNKFLDQVKGIAIYAALSAAIYGVMTAMTNLAVATVKMADEYTSIQNRMKLYINDSQTLATVNRNLGKMAMENNVGLRETATLYTRLAPALQKLGGNAATVTSVVDAFGKSMRIGGATAQEAASATIQFSQAMASGKLAGDEFRSISEASPRFLKAIADGSGIATESLKKLSSEGFLTTSLVARALLREYPTLIEENKKLGVTLEQGGNAFKTAFIMAVGELNEGAKVTETIGNALLDVAKNLSEFAQTARQTGVEAKASFEKYLPVIQAVGNVLEFVAIVAITKFAASMIVAGAISLKTAYNMNIAALGATALQRAFGVAAIAAIRLGSALTSLATPKNLATLALTVAGVAASYLLLRDNAAEATNKIVEQSEYVDLTTEAYKKLNAEQQKNAQASLTEDMGKINAELDSQADAVNRVLLSYAQFKQMQANALNKETADVINQTVKGLISYDTAYRKLIDLGVPKNVVEDFKKQKDVYDEAAKAGLKTEAAARAAGLGIKLSGNEAQNATPAVQGLKDGVDGLAATSLNAADSFAKMVEGFKTGVADIKTTLKVMQSYDLEKGISQQLIKKSQALAKQHPAIVEANSAIQKGKEKEIAALGAKPSQKQLNAITERYDAIGKTVLKAQESFTETYIKQGAPYAQELQLWTEKESKFISDKNKQDKQDKQEKPPKKSDINNFQEQLTLAQEYVSLLNQGVDLDVAKIAATKEYVKWYGTNLDMAKSLVAVDKQRAEIEKQRQEQEQKREAKKQGYKTVIDDLNAMKNKSKFIVEGFLPSVAEKSASLGFTPDPAGIQYAQKATTLELEKQADAYRNSAIEKRNILELTKSGRTVEEAQIDNLLYTNKHLLPEQLVLFKQIKELQEIDRRADISQKVANESNTMLRQAAIYSSMQNNDLGDIANSYDTINKSEVQHLNSWKDIVQKVKEYNDYLVNQKANPLGDFSTIDFSVFGDFGNPFESALSGLNLLLGGADALKEKYDQNFAALDQQAKEAAGNEDTLARIKLIRATLEKKQIVDQKNLQQQQVTAALKGAKAFFKENSKGYKALTTLEQLHQGIRIALAIEEAAVKIGLVEKTTLATMAANAKQQISDGVTAAVSSMKGLPFPYNIAAMGATIAAIAGLGVAIGGGFGSSSGSFAPTNEGTGTVFGDSEAKSASIANSIDLLSENSDLMLPLTSAMLRSLRNIESNIGGVTNLILRQATGGEGFNVQDGFKQNTAGKLVGGAGQIALGGVGAVGGALGGAFASGLLGASAGSALGIGLGVLTGGIGLLLGAALGKALGGLFGSKTTVKGQGLFGADQSLASILENGFSLQEYADVNTKKKALGITTSNKNKTILSAADQQLANQFTLIFEGFYDSILNASTALGMNVNTVADALEGTVISMGKINLQGLSGEEIQEKLEAVFGAAADKLAQTSVKGLDDFQRVGEGYYETLVRVATGIEQANYFTDRLNVTTIKYADILNKQGDVAAEMVRQSVLLVEGNKNINGGFYDLVNTFEGTADELTDFVLTLRDLQDQLFMTGKNANYLTSAMILGAGGLDKLSSGFDAYFEMLSPAEQAAELTRRLTKEFAILGEELPADVKAFRNLLNDTNKIDITTEAGQKLYGQIIALAPEFNDLQDSIKSANSEVNALVQSLRDLAEQARAARGETEQPRNLAYTRSQFEQTSILAMQGDTKAAEKLLTLGKDLMGLSKTYSVSGSEYARDLALIQRAATVSADIQEQGLGTSISTTLTPSTGTGTTTPTIATTNSTMTTELQGMREELNAGLFAIAKFVQKVDSRTERWDDGGRMMVGIQPEKGDAPVPVVVTP